MDVHQLLSWQAFFACIKQLLGILPISAEICSNLHEIIPSWAAVITISEYKNFLLLWSWVIKIKSTIINVETATLFWYYYIRYQIYYQSFQVYRVVLLSDYLTEPVYFLTLAIYFIYSENQVGGTFNGYSRLGENSDEYLQIR